MLTQLCSLTKPAEVEILCVGLKAKRKEEINKFGHDQKVCEAQHEHLSRDLQLVPRMSRMYEPTVVHQLQYTATDVELLLTRTCIDKYSDLVMEGFPNALSSAQCF